MNELFDLLNENTRIIENKLIEYLKTTEDNGLCELMSYSLLSGGKRIRPFLVLETYKLFSKCDDVTPAIPYACALEMIHTYSLIHDDLPCMDNDDLRRGKPTSHKVFGEAKALLAGDTMLTYAFEVLASNQKVSKKSISLATVALAKCAGFAGMAGGQMLDLEGEAESLDELLNIHRLKTGALIKCAMILGYLAYCDEPDDKILKDLEIFATNVGIAFQFRDDILDRISNSETLGKMVGSDDKNGKVTALSFMSVEKAQEMINRLTDEAVSTIDYYYDSESFHSLSHIARYMAERNK